MGLRQKVQREMAASALPDDLRAECHRFWRYPAFAVEGQPYVGSDFARVDSLIAQALRRKEETTRVSPNATTSN